MPTGNGGQLSPDRMCGLCGFSNVMRTRSPAYSSSKMPGRGPPSTTHVAVSVEVDDIEVDEVEGTEGEWKC